MAEAKQPAALASEQSALLQPAVSWAVAGKLLRGKADAVAVPATWPEAHAVFWQHPTVICAAASLLYAVGARLASPLGLLDGIALITGAVLWTLQEWFIHAKLFHGDVDWFGKRVHEGHHRTPYHHISLDAPELALPVILAAGAVFTAALGQQLGASTAVGYVSLGLLYQFSHFAVHTRAVPRSKFWRRVRQHHMQHHCRNENYWLAFTLPQMDDWMGTNPAASAVPMTPLARAAISGTTAAEPFARTARSGGTAKPDATAT